MAKRSMVYDGEAVETEEQGKEVAHEIVTHEHRFTPQVEICLR